VKAALVLIFLLPALANISMPMAPIQIILLELFMDLAASAGFVAEPQEKDIYSRPPRNPKESVLSKRVVRDILLNGLLLFAGVTGIYLFARGQKLDQTVAQTFAFTAWIFGHIFLAFVSRSDRESVFTLGLFTNSVMNVWAVAAIALLAAGVYLPIVGQQLNLTAIPFTQFIAIAGVMLVIMGLLEVKKLVLKGE